MLHVHLFHSCVLTSTVTFQTNILTAKGGHYYQVSHCEMGGSINGLYQILPMGYTGRESMVPRVTLQFLQRLS